MGRIGREAGWVGIRTMMSGARMETGWLYQSQENRADCTQSRSTVCQKLEMRSDNSPHSERSPTGTLPRRRSGIPLSPVLWILRDPVSCPRVAAGRKNKGETFSLSRRHTTLRLATRQVDQVVDDTDMIFSLLFHSVERYTALMMLTGKVATAKHSEGSASES